MANNKVTHGDYALLSNAIYQEYSPTGWIEYKCTHPKKTNVDGYVGCAYQKGDVLIVAHRGTQPQKLYGLVDDLQIALNALPNHYYSAVSFVNNLYKNISGSDLSIVGHAGHSLGGCITELMIAHYPVVLGVAFESPGALDIVKRHKSHFSKVVLETVATRLTLYNAAPNLINGADLHLAPIIRLYPGYDLKKNDAVEFTLQQHSIDNLVNQFDIETGSPNVYGDMGDLWSKSADWTNLKSRIPELFYSFFHMTSTLNKDFLQNYNSNPYLLESIFDSDNLNTARRIAKIDSEGGIGDPSLKGVDLFGNDKANQIWGGSNFADQIYSGNGDDIIWIFSGNDKISDSSGHDQYNFYLHNMKGEHIIVDQDGKGSLYMMNIKCNLQGVFSGCKDKFIPKNHGDCDTRSLSGKSSFLDFGISKFYKFIKFDHEEDVFTLEVDGDRNLHITYNNPYFDSVSRIPAEIIISNFSNGDFGISMASCSILGKQSIFEVESTVLGEHNLQI